MLLYDENSFEKINSWVIEYWNSSFDGIIKTKNDSNPTINDSRNHSFEKGVFSVTSLEAFFNIGLRLG